MTDRAVPFSRPFHCSEEGEAIAQVLATGSLVGGGTATLRAQSLIQAMTGTSKAFLTSSGTAALEMACLLLNLENDDEVIMPSFTFSSCANAAALRGAVPVFVDIRPDTMNLNEELIEAAVTRKTRAIMPVHYAGVGAEMNAIVAIAQRHGLAVIEDAAQAVLASYCGRALGTFGMLGAFSFHGTKNISAGEAGALLVNDSSLVERAERFWEKGTNRSQFVRGEIDKYTWVDIGSSFLPSEITAALLACQLERAAEITSQRREVWKRYHSAFVECESDGHFRRPLVPRECQDNAHIYAILLKDAGMRDAALKALKAAGISATSHYVPLHSAPAGLRFGRAHGSMSVTDDVSARLLRLPIFSGMSTADQDHVIDRVKNLSRRNWIT